MRIPALCLMALGALAASPAAAEVAQSSPAGFVVQGSVTAAATPAETWSALVAPARWWNPAHSWSGSAANLSLEPSAGGCFCETLPEGGSAEHMRVIHVVPGEMLRMSGALGPLQSEALTGTLTIELTAEGAGTRIAWAYVVGGYSRFEEDTDIPAAVDFVLNEQFSRLAALLEPGE